jgi:hypothetical protein
MRIEVATAKKGNAEDLEVAGSNDVQFGDGLVRGVDLLAFDEELVVEGGRFVEWEDAGGRGGSDSGKGLDFFEERIEEAEGFIVAGVAGEIEAELDGENVFGAEAGVDPLEIDEAAHGEACSDEEEERDGDLGDDKSASEFAARGAERGLGAAFL